jgi:predicted permease
VCSISKPFSEADRRYFVDNLIFSLNVTIPIFLMMCIGLVLKKLKLFDDRFVSVANKFVFQIALPALLFLDIGTADFHDVWDSKFVLFCFFATLLSILAMILVSYLFHDRSIQGEFVQSAYRSSAALLGIAFIQNIYGNSGMGPLMIIASVPLYNIMAVVVLNLLKPDRGKLNRATLIQTLKGIATNPIILGICAGLIWSVFQLPMPVILSKTASNLASLATPLGLMAMGASFEWKKALEKRKPAVICSTFKLVVFCAVFLPVAVWLGFRTQALIAILVMLGSPTTVSCFIMAKNMGHEGTLSSSVIMITTLFSAFTLTFWLYLLKSMALI